MATTRKRTGTAAEPWDRPKPAGARKALTPKRKSAAKAAARKAGRPYPNLVDNMREAAKQRPTKKRSTKKRTMTKRPATKRSATKRTATKRTAKKR